MRIVNYSCTGVAAGDWDFSPVDLQQLNLLVGDSATGKTRFLNSLFNVGTFVASDQYRPGKWALDLLQDGIRYSWQVRTERRAPNKEPRVTLETLVRHGEGQPETLVDRTESVFRFKGRDLPKLSPALTALSILRAEPDIAPVFQGFTKIQRRDFSGPELTAISQVQSLAPELLSPEANLTTDQIYYSQPGLNNTLVLLSKHQPDVFARIREVFITAFPFVEEVTLRRLNDINPNIPSSIDILVFCIREKGSTSWIPIIELSSGMRKVLLIITDMHVMPDDGIYMIDEYENSLGIGAIDFFPEFILNFESEIQLLITSHHPYLINNIPPSNWYVFHRTGSSVDIEHGPELVDRFGKSKQQYFVKLINDPLYKNGIG